MGYHRSCGYNFYFVCILAKQKILLRPQKTMNQRYCITVDLEGQAFRCLKFTFILSVFVLQPSHAKGPDLSVRPFGYIKRKKRKLSVF